MVGWDLLAAAGCRCTGVVYVRGASAKQRPFASHKRLIGCVMERACFDGVIVAGRGGFQHAFMRLHTCPG